MYYIYVHMYVYVYIYTYIYTYIIRPPTNGERLRDFYHNSTNSILQQLERKLWKIADAFFRISSITNSFQYAPPCTMADDADAPPPHITAFFFLYFIRQTLLNRN